MIMIIGEYPSPPDV